MPIYEYQCEACGAHLEKLQKISDPILRDCPECHKSSLKKMISASSFRLKGTGWYETDFKTGNKKHGAEDKEGKEGKEGKESKGLKDGKTSQSDKTAGKKAAKKKAAADKTKSNV